MKDPTPPTDAKAIEHMMESCKVLDWTVVQIVKDDGNAIEGMIVGEQAFVEHVLRMGSVPGESPFIETPELH